jgi:hypothetical protein
MKLNDLSALYLDCLMGKRNVDGGIEFIDSVDINKLNGRIESLSYIDSVLDEINRENIDWDKKLEDQGAINFLYALGFYVGSVIENETKQKVNWYSWEQMIDLNPTLSGALPRTLGTSILCTHAGAMFIPLSSIMTRLIEGPDEKSVSFSAQGQISAINSHLMESGKANVKSEPKKPWYKIW